MSLSQTQKLIDKGFSSGDEIFVKYQGDQKYYARIVLFNSSDDSYFLIAPGNEIVKEDLGMTGIRIEMRQTDSVVPSRIAKGLIDFDEFPDQDEFNVFHGEACELYAADEIAEEVAPRESYMKGRPSKGYVGKLAGDQDGEGPGGTKRALLSPAPSNSPRAPPALSGGLASLAAALGSGGPGAFVKPEVDKSDDRVDVRVLPVRYDHNGQRYRDFRSVADVCHTLAWDDWPVPGPRTAAWVLKFMIGRAGGPLGWHAMWRANGRLQESDPWVLQHEALCRILETSGSYDQLDLCANASSEILCRQIQICEDQLSHKFEEVGGNVTAEYHLMSGAQQRSQLCICPALKSWLAGEIAKDSAILKERRKAREERALANPKGKAKPG